MTYSCAIFPELDGDLVQSASRASSPRQSPSRTPALSTGTSTPSTLADTDAHDAPKAMELNSLGLFSAPARGQGEHAEPDDPLEAAQYRKLQHIIRKADIRPGHRVRTPAPPAPSVPCRI